MIYPTPILSRTVALAPAGGTELSEFAPSAFRPRLRGTSVSVQ